MLSTSLLRKRSPLLASLFATSLIAVAPQAFAAPFEPDLAQTIDDYLAEQESPMAGSGAAFVTAGLRYDVDPRLVVAIASEESSLGTAWGTCPESGNNAWNFVYAGTCADSTFGSFEQGFEAVTKYLRRAYFDKWALSSVDDIAAIYCTESCDTWADGVEEAYTALGGDLSDLTFGSSETLIDFEQFTGPSVFGSVDPPLTVDGLVTFTGGQMLNGATNLPADRSVLYGTAYFCTNCEPIMTLDFAVPVSRFSFFLYNGLTTPITYTVESDKGDSETVTLASNSNSGATTIFFESTGIEQVTLSGFNSADQWDYFVDNIRFTSGAAPAEATSATTASSASRKASVRNDRGGVTAVDPRAGGAMPR